MTVDRAMTTTTATVVAQTQLFIQTLHSKLIESYVQLAHPMQVSVAEWLARLTAV